MGNPRGESDKGPPRVDVAQLRRISEVTIGHYDRSAGEYRDGTWDHDVSQNYTAFLGAIEGDHPFSILDLGCDLGHFAPVGQFCQAKVHDFDHAFVGHHDVGRFNIPVGDTFFVGGL